MNAIENNDPRIMFPDIPDAVEWHEDPKGKYAWGIARENRHQDDAEYEVFVFKAIADRLIATRPASETLQIVRKQMDHPQFTEYVRWKLAQDE